MKNAFKTLLFTLLTWIAGSAASAAPSVAFHFGHNPPTALLEQYNIVVLDPFFLEITQDIRHLNQDANHQVFAKLPVGEIHPCHPCFSTIPQELVLKENPIARSKVIDHSAPLASSFFQEQVVQPLLKQGFTGFYLESLDTPQLFANDAHARDKQRQGIISTIRDIKASSPSAGLLMHRGFDLLPELAPVTMAIVGDALYRGYDASEHKYYTVTSRERAFLLTELVRIRERYGLPVITIEKIDPELAQLDKIVLKTAQAVEQHGFSPWITDRHIASMMHSQHLA